MRIWRGRTEEDRKVELTKTEARQAGRGYNITATSAAQDLSRTNIVELEGIKANFSLTNNGMTELLATKGLYDAKGDIVRLTEGIVIRSTAGYEVRTVLGTWTETAVTYNNAPAVGATAAGVSNKPFTTGTWTSVDVTSLVTSLAGGNGLVDLVMTPLSSTAINFNSRQGANPPQLVVEFGGSALAAAEPVIAAPPVFDLPPDSLDTDGDGAPDAVEILSDGSPNVADTDGDGLLDLWEIENGLSPADAEGGDGAEGDPDGDGIANLEEQRRGIDPLNWDGMRFSPGPHPLYLPLVSGQ